MPIIAEHNRTHRAEGHAPLGAWPDDCQVQWGGSGLVIRRDGGAYGTAFFEAFPAGGGFFRGEGPDLAAAEAACLAKYLRFTGCDHLWGRRGYTNGGAVCRRCGAFMTRFRPIPRLGAFRDPLSATELDLAMDGYCRPDRADRFQARLRLRLIRAGIRLPDPGVADFGAACREAVLTWYRENRDRVGRDGARGMSALLDGLALRRLDAEAA